MSVCSAKNKDDAAWLFDEVGPISRKLIIKLKAQILFTAKLDVDEGWILDGDGALGEDIFLEVMKRCYPHYDKAFGGCEPDAKTGA